MKTHKIMAVLCAVVLMFAMSTAASSAYADDEQETGAAVASVYDYVRLLALPLGAIGIAGSGAQMLWGSESDGEKAKKRIIVILCALVAIWFIPAVAVWGRNQLGGMSWSPEAPAG